MFLSKKSVLKSLLIIGLLGMPQKTESFAGWATALVVTSLTYCIGTYVTRHNNVSSFIRNQDKILRYIAYVWVYPGRHYRQKTTVVLESTSPEVMIEKIMDFAQQYSTSNCSIRIRLAVVVDEGNIVQLKKVRVNTRKTAKLKAKLEKRLLIPNRLHLTYRNKLALGATVPLLAGAGPLALVLPAVLII